MFYFRRLHGLKHFFERGSTVRSVTIEGLLVSRHAKEIRFTAKPVTQCNGILR